MSKAKKSRAPKYEDKLDYTPPKKAPAKKPAKKAAKTKKK